MKTRRYSLLKKPMAVSAVLYIMLIYLCGDVFAQLPFASQSMLAVQGNDRAPISGMRDLSVTPHLDVVFINLVMKGEMKESVILLERSVDDMDFIVLDKQDVKSTSDNSVEMLYSFRDKAPETGNIYYRVRQFRDDGILYSKVVLLDRNAFPVCADVPVR
jgi:hypothetical protein